MSIVRGLDIHRHQVTFDVVDDATGEVWRGQVRPAGDSETGLLAADYGIDVGRALAARGANGGPRHRKATAGPVVA